MELPTAFLHHITIHESYTFQWLICVLGLLDLEGDKVKCHGQLIQQHNIMSQKVWISSNTVVRPSNLTVSKQFVLSTTTALLSLDGIYTTAVTHNSHSKSLSCQQTAYLQQHSRCPVCLNQTIPSIRVLLEKLRVLHTVKKFQVIYRHLRCINMFTGTYHWPLQEQTKPVHVIPFFHTLSPLPRPCKWCLPFRFLTTMITSVIPFTYITRDSIIIIISGKKTQITKYWSNSSRTD